MGNEGWESSHKITRNEFIVELKLFLSIIVFANIIICPLTIYCIYIELFK